MRPVGAPHNAAHRQALAVLPGTGESHDHKRPNHAACGRAHSRATLAASRSELFPLPARILLGRSGATSPSDRSGQGSGLAPGRRTTHGGPGRYSPPLPDGVGDRPAYDRARHLIPVHSLAIGHLPGHRGPADGIRGGRNRPSRTRTLCDDRRDRARRHRFGTLPDPPRLAPIGITASLPRHGARSEPGRRQRGGDPSARAGRDPLRGRWPCRDPSSPGSRSHLRPVPPRIATAAHLRPGEFLRGTG